jgi:hypothetical protein
MIKEEKGVCNISLNKCLLLHKSSILGGQREGHNPACSQGSHLALTEACEWAMLQHKGTYFQRALCEREQAS